MHYTMVKVLIVLFLKSNTLKLVSVAEEKWLPLQIRLVSCFSIWGNLSKSVARKVSLGELAVWPSTSSFTSFPIPTLKMWTPLSLSFLAAFKAEKKKKKNDQVMFGDIADPNKIAWPYQKHTLLMNTTKL